MKKILLSIALTISISFNLSAQEGEPGGGGEQPLQQEVPIDGGLTIALAAAAAYGVKRVKQQRKIQLRK